MKFSWKLFFSSVIIITLAFGCGGFFLISSLFESGLSREKEASMQENRFLYASLYSDFNTMQVYDSQGLDAAVAQLQSYLNRSGTSQAYIGRTAKLHFNAREFASSLEPGTLRQPHCTAGRYLLCAGHQPPAADGTRHDLPGKPARHHAAL